MRGRGKGKKFISIRQRRIGGFVLFMFGFGMSFGLLLTTWAFILAAIIITVGFWLMFL